MYSRRLKIGYFTLEGLNSFATTLYFFYFYFLMQQQFGYGNRANLLVAALNGALYAVAAWAGGRFAQRFGYFAALRLGFALLIGSLAAGSQLMGSAAAQIIVLLIATIGTCLTWPALEALVSEGETAAGLPQMVGIYNVVWAATGAVAYFTGGAMLQNLGMKCMFYVPVGIQVVQLALTLWLEKQARRSPHGSASAPAAPAVDPATAARARNFKLMAWLANPFAYVAINTLVAVIPGVAQRLELSTMLAGFCCSVWCFGRFGAFVGLWLWTDWHYRFRWLVAAYVALVGSFALILLVPSLATLVVAQLVFGGAIGLIYYSSLFYSMDNSDTKGEHGGIHEAVIGLGNFAGPAVGATSLYLLPQYPQSGALAVSGLLLVGLAGLAVARRAGRS